MYTWIDNQPIALQSAQLSTCCPEDQYSQLLLPSDIPQLQIKAFPCEDQEALTPYDIDGTGEWIQGYDQTVCSESAAAGLLILDFPTYGSETLFQITVTITSITGTLTLSLTDGESYQFTAPGRYTIYLQKPVSNRLRMTFSSSDFIGCFSYADDDLIVIPVKTNYLVGIFDNLNVCHGVFEGELSGGNYITFKMDLTDKNVPEGCYRFSVLDPCENTCGQNGICNGQFASDYLIGGGSCWIPSNDVWSLDSNAAIYNNDTVSFQTMKNTTILCTGKTYSITYTIYQIDSQCSFQVAIGANTGTLRTAVGTYTDIIVASDVGSFPNNLVFIGGQSASGDRVIIVNNCIVELVNDNDYAPNELSVPVRVGYPTGSECFFLLEGCCGSDQFGFEFTDSGFKPFIRVQAGIDYASPEIDGETFRFNSGRKIVQYWDRIWKRTLGSTVPVPQYVHQFMSIIIAFDNWFIQGNQFTPSEASYEIGDVNNGLAHFSISIEEHIEKIRKVNCSGINATCEPSVEGAGKLFQSGEEFEFQNQSRYDFQ